ncbi:MAG: hypothetical protein K0S39_6256, partial [Paenibacillus sp.]|nr:hypothetical protein [Paenibacillus sp.]
REAAERYGIPKAYGDALELIHDPEVESVHNCTPNDLHYPLNKAVLLANKHLMSEKPLAMSSEQSLELSIIARQNRCISGVSYVYRHFPLISQARQLMAEEVYSRPHHVHGGYLQDWLLYETDYNWRLDPARNGPSRAIADIGSHWCDTLQFVLGRKIVEVFADLQIVHPIRYKQTETKGSTFLDQTFPPGEREMKSLSVTTEDGGNILVRFEDGISGVFTVSQASAGRKNRLFFEIAAHRGSVAWNQEEPNTLWIGLRDSSDQTVIRDPNQLGPAARSMAHYPAGHQEGWPDAMKNLLISFYNAVQKKAYPDDSNGRQAEIEYPFCTIEEGHRTMQIVEAILKSHRTKSWVAVPDL